jgi:hypothetical protein
VILQFDLAFDVPFDREIFAAIQLALDDDWPIFTTSLSIRRGSGCGAVVAGWMGATGAAEAVGVGWLLVGFTASSRFHMSCPPRSGLEY